MMDNHLQLWLLLQVYSHAGKYDSAQEERRRKVMCIVGFSLHILALIESAYLFLYFAILELTVLLSQQTEETE